MCARIQTYFCLIAQRLITGAANVVGVYSCTQIEGLPTIVFIPKDEGKPALRTEGLLQAAQIVQIVKEM
jgi:hypothetical protein